MITIDESDETPIAVTVIMIDTPGVTPAAVDPYTIQGSRSDFMVDANGAITANVDYDNLTESEQMNGINITVDVKGSTAGQSASITINVMVTNLDDEAPVILPPPENITVIAGTSDLSSPVTIVAADSADGALGNDAEITYAFVDTTGAIVEPNAARLSLFDDFAIHADTGLITVADAPDYSLTASENTRTLTIQATDTSSGATGATTARAEIEIAVEPPSVITVSSQAGNMITIAESDETPIAVTVIMIDTPGVTPAAVDPYTIQGSRSDFMVDATGAITANVDYDNLTESEQMNGINITVDVKGSTAGQSASITINVMVTNLDDEAPVFDAIPRDITVKDRATVFNKTVEINATDSADGALGNDAEITYAFVDITTGAIVEPNAARLSIFDDFAIHADTGLITVHTAPVFSAATPDNARTLTIQATDTSSAATGATTARAEIEISVEPPSVITVSSQAGNMITIAESDETPIAVTVIMIDTPGVTPAAVDPYTIQGSRSDFMVDATGAITANVDYDATILRVRLLFRPSRSPVTIVATDSADGALGTGATTARAEIEIAVEPPTIQSSVDCGGAAQRHKLGNMITIDESDETPIAVTVIMIDTPGVTPAAVDPYTIQGSRSDFMVDATGAITANADYDNLTESEQMNGINITVDVEGSIAGQSASITINVMVTNLDDEAPVFDAIPRDITVKDRATVFNKTVEINATDSADGALGNDAEITYAFVDITTGAIVEPNAARLSLFDDFAIHADTGLITVHTAPVFSAATPGDNARRLTVRATDTSVGASGKIKADTNPFEITVTEILIDSDRDGLIDIEYLEQLDNMRHNPTGSGYQMDSSSQPISSGCPDGVCRGYELMRDLDFTDPNSYEMGMTNSDWLLGGAGWTPIGPAAMPFAADFNGNGYTISNLYISADGNHEPAGLFGDIKSDRPITIGNVVLEDVNISSNKNVGGLAGILRSQTIYAVEVSGVVTVLPMSGGGEPNAGLVAGRSANGVIIASGVVAMTDGSESMVALNDTDLTNPQVTVSAGGLVGRSNGMQARIISSFSKAKLVGRMRDLSRIDDNIGGLVGFNGGGSQIIASYADSNIRSPGSNFSHYDVGGLVGSNDGSSVIRSSYAVFEIDGAARTKYIGGLVGSNGAEVRSSYAVGTLDGNINTVDRIGLLIGFNTASDAMVTASYGFGEIDGAWTAANREDGVGFSDDASRQIISFPRQLTIDNSSTIAGNRWDTSIWDFGSELHYPVVRWITSDALGCDSNLLPDGQMCGDPIPGQYDLDGDGNADPTPAAPTIEIEYSIGAGFQYFAQLTLANLSSEATYEIRRDGESIAENLTGNSIVYNDTVAIMVGRDVTYTAHGVNGIGAGAFAELIASPVNDIIKDGDNDGLIDITNRFELQNARYNLNGLCPNLGGGCRGYELLNDIDLENVEWRPIGNQNGSFNSLFEGNGFAIRNLSIQSPDNLTRLGLFGSIESGATIRSTGVINYNITGNDGSDFIGGLVGWNSGGKIITSYVTSDATSLQDTGRVMGGGGIDYIGLLVGYIINDGSITASYAVGRAFGGGGADSVGGLVGYVDGAEIRNSYAHAPGDSGVYAAIATHGEDIDALTVSDGAVGDMVGGLIGESVGTDNLLYVSYTTGSVAGGDGANDLLGRIVGSATNSLMSQNTSYGFGERLGGAEPVSATDRARRDGPDYLVHNDDTTLPITGGIAGARMMLAPGSGGSGAAIPGWNQAGNPSVNLGAWDFGSDSEAPGIRYADYDGAGTDYNCDMFPGALPSGESLVCGNPDGSTTGQSGSLLPHQMRR